MHSLLGLRHWHSLFFHLNRSRNFICFNMRSITFCTVLTIKRNQFDQNLSKPSLSYTSYKSLKKSTVHDGGQCSFPHAKHPCQSSRFISSINNPLLHLSSPSKGPSFFFTWSILASSYISGS